MNWVFNNRFDGDIDYLKSLHKRVNSLADKNAIPNHNHVLWTVWSNMKVMLDKNNPDYYQEVMYFTAVMAKKIDDYAINNMLTGDPTVAKILAELDEIKPCAYELLEF